MIPQGKFPFWPPYPPTPYLGKAFFLGGGWRWGWRRGSKLRPVLRLLCVDSSLGPKEIFLVYGPPNPWQGSRVPTLGKPPPPPLCAIFPLAKQDSAVCAGYWHLKIFQNAISPEISLSPLEWVWVVIWLQYVCFNTNTDSRSCRWPM